jgi:Cu/Ag efflux protein CusF
MSSRSFLAIALAAAAFAPAAVVAQPVEHGRGNIVSIDWNRLTVDLKDPQGRVATWKFNRNATVKFSDAPQSFPSPSTQDLRPPMYVHYTFRNEVIDSFDVVELGYQPGREEGSSSGARKQQGVSRTVTGQLTAFDPNVRQIEIEHGGRRETFQLTGTSQMGSLAAGQRVQVRTEWSGQRELVADLRVLGREGTNPPGRSASSNLPASDGVDDSQTAEGRVVRVSPRGVVMEVAGARQTYGVTDSALVRRLRVGETIRFTWADRNGQLFITDVR